jgi:hypothetical protein
MGADIIALLQIDDNTPRDQPPFTNDPSTWDLSRDYSLSSGKHYTFYAAICGVRNESGIQPLFACRGIPPTGSGDVQQCFDNNDPNVSWLTTSEIYQALKHVNIAPDSLAKPVQFLLRVMQSAEDFYGPNRVRLVFQVED